MAKKNNPRPLRNMNMIGAGAKFEAVKGKDGQTTNFTASVEKQSAQKQAKKPALQVGESMLIQPAKSSPSSPLTNRFKSSTSLSPPSSPARAELSAGLKKGAERLVSSNQKTTTVTRSLPPSKSPSTPEI